jgi:hypothetical protein
MHWMFSNFFGVNNELMWFIQQEHMFKFHAWWNKVMLNKFLSCRFWSLCPIIIHGTQG